MRFRTLEIRWHDSKPISTCDFQPVPFKKARPQDKNAFAGQSYRLATGGEDNHVRLWMVHPKIMPPSVVLENASVLGSAAARQPRVEYLATLSRHSAAVNVVRFSPNGELIASAGDDGMIIIWAPSNTPQVSTYGSDLSAEDLQFEKEHWKPRTTFRCTTMQVYDMAWSPSGEYILAGSTDNTARVFAAHDGKCVHEIAEHSHYVQGVAWDPLNEYIATQSSDRSMHVYRISTKSGAFEAHAVGKNTRMPHRHSRTPSTHSASASRPRMIRSQSIASDAESAVTSASELLREEGYPPSSGGPSHHNNTSSGSASNNNNSNAPLTPAASLASTPSASMFPPPLETPSSRRSSFSGSNAPSSPAAQFARFGRSPSPMPALPAIRALPSTTAWTSIKLYGDESFTNFFRRLTFSPDGGLLLTPAGQFEDPSVIPGSSRSGKPAGEDVTPSRGRKGRPSVGATGTFEPTNPTSASSVFIYSRANFARPPIAQLPGHKKASVAVRFSPVLYELRQGAVGGGDGVGETAKSAVVEKGKEGTVDVDLVGPVQGTTSSASTPYIAAPAPLPAFQRTALPSPALSPTEYTIHPHHPPTPSSQPSTPAPASSQPTPNPNTGTNAGSVFALPYRMLFAVVTMDTVTIYDTQQAGPVCMLTKLHYDEFTDMTWSPDGQCLLLSSRDGYCTLIVFDEILPAHHTQQQALQLQSIAHQHSLPISISFSNSNSSSGAGMSGMGGMGGMSMGGTPGVTPAATPAREVVGLPFVAMSTSGGGMTTPTMQTPVGTSKKRSEPPITPASSVGEASAGSIFVSHAQSTPSRVAAAGEMGGDSAGAGASAGTDTVELPPKKKRRVALTRVEDLGS